MHRIEFNIATDAAVEVQQNAYKNTDGELLILDDGKSAPPGFAPITEDEALSMTRPDPVTAQIAAIQAQIDQLERDSLMNRGVRELSLRQMEFMAQQLGQDLATIPAYVKFKALDDQITELRGQIWLLSEQS